MRFARSSYTGTRALDWRNGEASIPTHEIDMNARLLLHQRRQQAGCPAAHLNVLASVAAGRKTDTNCEHHNSDIETQLAVFQAFCLVLLWPPTTALGITR